MNKNGSWFTLTFEWNSLVRDLVRNSWAIILAALIAFMGIQVVEQSLYTPTYTSKAVLVVRSKIGTSGAYSNLEASSEMAAIFTDVFKQNSVKKLAAENLGLKSFDGQISTSVDETTNLLNISVKSADPELSFKLLKSVLEVYPRVSDAVFTNAVIDVLSEPLMPTRPSNSVLTRYRNHIILLAMALEAGMIILLSLLRETVKEEKGFSDKIDAKLIGTVTHERSHVTLKERFKRKKRALLINDAFASLRFAEDYQKLATKFEYLKKHDSKKVFAITSIAENEGKSTIAVNTAIALSNRGYKVALLDLDVHKPSIYKIFDFYDKIDTDFTDVLTNKVNLNDFRFFRYRKSDLVIAFNKKSYDDTNEIFKGEGFAECIKSLREKMDFVIIDTPPTSASADAYAISSVTDSTLLVIRTDCVPVRDINDAILAVSDTGGSLAGCVLNNVYKPFTLMGQMGTDETGYAGYSNYYGYSKYSRPALAVDNADDGFSENSFDSLNR